MADRLIQELRVVRGGKVMFIHFAHINGEWIDLAPYGNRLPCPTD